MNRRRLISLALSLAERTAQFVEHVRAFFYRVVLCLHACPVCGRGLAMTGESRCRCRACRRDFDPTVVYQRCTVCGGQARLRIRRYECSDCGSDIDSRFVFDGLVFDADYFRQKMTEHRQRKREQRECVRQMLAGSRSPALAPGALDLDSVPGLLDALNGLTSSPPELVVFEPKAGFDLKHYQRHIRAHTQPVAVSFGEIPPLDENARLDRIWRFVAIIFLAHAGLIEVWQDGSDVMVMQREVDGEGCSLSGELENADGVERPVGGVEA